MEVNKFLKNLKLSRKEREINYWTEQYELAINSLNKSFNINDELINKNKTQIDKLKVKYSFYNDLIDLIIVARDLNTLKENIVSLIISYLEIVYENGNIILEKGNIKSISKKTYGVEKKKILKDLRIILKEAIYYRMIKILSEQKKDRIMNNSIKIKPFTLTTSENEDSFPEDELQNTSVNKKSPQLKLFTKKNSSQKDKVKNISVNIRATSPLKPGRKKYSVLAVYALKYHVIHEFYKSQNPYSNESEYSSIGQFYESIAEKESLNKNSFSNSYKKIQREGNLEKYCRSEPEVVKALIRLNCFSDYKKCADFLSQFNANMK